MKQFSEIAWELSVLGRAVAYGNLSTAALHVGLSQPQLSRIVSKLERELGVALLDRSSRRKSGWTAQAFKIVEAYLKASQLMEAEIQKASEGAEMRQFRIGTLEGLGNIAVEFAHALLSQESSQTAQLNVYDLDALEEEFLRENLEFVFTIREPSRKKFKYAQSLGTQQIEHVSRNMKFSVLSPFEIGIQKKKREESKTFISNSLALRKLWLEKFGGRGDLPGELQKRSSKAAGNDVLLIGSELLPPRSWERVLKIAAALT